MRHIFWPPCVISVHELICISGIYVTFDGHIGFWHICGNSLPKKCYSFLFTFGRCTGLEMTDFWQILLWKSMMVLKALILDNFYFRRVWWSVNKQIVVIFSLSGWDGLERTDFKQFLLWQDTPVIIALVRIWSWNSTSLSSDTWGRDFPWSIYRIV